MATAVAPAVHRELPGFKAFREFCGRHDTCMQDSMTEILASLDQAHWAADCAHMNIIAGAMLANGRLKAGGSTMSGGVAQLRDMGWTVDYAPWQAWHPELGLDLLHQLVKDLAGTYGIILQVGKAYNLPDNEKGVYSHFVAIGGIDSNLGYLIGNGDIPLARFHGAEWVGWASIVAANPTAVCVIHPKVIPTVANALAAAHWTDTAKFDPTVFGGFLIDPHGKHAHSGFRQWILTHDWDPQNYIVTEEFQTTLIEPGNPAMGGGARINFRGVNGHVVSLGYLPKPINGHPAGVYIIWAGQDLPALVAQIQAQAAQLATAQAQLAAARSAATKLSQIKAIADAA